MITTRDQYYGVVLRHLTKDGQRPRVAEIGDKAGHFCINDDAFIRIKYSTQNSSPWRFTLQPDDIDMLVTDRSRGGLFGGSYLCLVCGFESLCVLCEREWKKLLDLSIPEAQQWVCISRTTGTQFSVSGSNGRLKRKIPASRFPSVIFNETK